MSNTGLALGVIPRSFGLHLEHAQGGLFNELGNSVAPVRALSVGSFVYLDTGPLKSKFDQCLSLAARGLVDSGLRFSR